MSKDDGLDRFKRKINSKQAVLASKDHKKRNDDKKKKKKEVDDKRKVALKRKLAKKS